MEQPIWTDADISYISTRAQSYTASEGYRKGESGEFSVVYGASLLAPMTVKEGTMDLWGNVKVPSYKALPWSSGAGGDWVQFPPLSDISSYTSLFGIPTSGIVNGNTSFLLQSTYLDLDCNNITSGEIVWDISIWPSMPYTDGLLSSDGPYVSSHNLSETADYSIGYKGIDLTPFKPFHNQSTLPSPDSLPANMTTGVYPAGTLLLQHWSNRETFTNIFCTPSQIYVESNITCIKSKSNSTCQVTAQRLSQLPHMPSEITYLSFREVVLAISEFLPNATTVLGPSPELVDQTINYIVNPDPSYIQTATESGIDLENSRLASIPLDTISTRLSQILNAFLYASLHNVTQYLTGASFENLNNDVGAIFDKPVANLTFKPALTEADLNTMIANSFSAFTVIGNITNLEEVYVCSPPWVSAFLLATSAMLGAAIVGAYIGSKTIVPDYLGYVSSLARDSVHVALPPGGVNLDGIERSRALKDLEVRLGDVCEGDSEVGQLRFATVGNASRVRKGRLYE
ncbi:hypothetical protein OEA41_010314 [Lepraria neglecta]|uniref:Uncharacterized protein n=1 Tax=Lepraria neglecta TaxID=209136 RepID=A0AAE0DHL1_9LECA|nr:hypothetical protein OEA41_010314 [Lepraria neglecta]